MSAVRGDDTPTIYILDFCLVSEYAVISKSPQRQKGNTMVIYIGDAGLVPWTAVGEVVDDASAVEALVYWDKKYFAVVPFEDLLPA